MKITYIIALMSMCGSLCAMHYQITKTPEELAPGQIITWHASEYRITDRAHSGNTAKVTMQCVSPRRCNIFFVETVTRTFTRSQAASRQWDEETPTKKYDPSPAVFVPASLAFCLACLYYLN